MLKLTIPELLRELVRDATRSGVAMKERERLCWKLVRHAYRQGVIDAINDANTEDK